MNKTRSIIVLGLIAAGLGGLIGVVAGGFLHFIEWGQHLLWQVVSIDLPLQPLIIGTLGGVLVGLCQRYLGDHPKGINEAVAEIRQTGRLDYAHLPHGLATISASLIFGASLGPESAIMDLIGGLSTWLGDVIRALRQRLAVPLAADPANRLISALRRWPNLTALAVGLVAFSRALNGLYSGGLLHVTESFQWSDLLWSVPLAVVGAAGGTLYLFLQERTRQWAAPLRSRPVLRGTLGGLALGSIALGLPFVLFSGQHALQSLYDQAAQLGFGLLFLTALARLMMTSVLLATGWKGGQFLPIMFGGAALGLSVSLLFPVIPTSVAVLSTMAALIAVVLPKPLIVLILMAVMFPLDYVGISGVAIGVVLIGQRLLKQRAARLSAAPAA